MRLCIYISLLLLFLAPKASGQNDGDRALQSEVEASYLAEAEQGQSKREVAPAYALRPMPMSFADSLQAENKSRVDALTIQPWKPNSGKALLWAILPGGGQIYNRKYWKVPIVWGAMLSCYYAISWNNKLYQEYHAAYRDINSEDPSQNTAWLSFAPAGATADQYANYKYLSSNLQRGNDYYRRYRDISIVLGILVYGLSFLDAYVDAELYTFDISPDLSMRISPHVATGGLNQRQMQVGVSCSFTF